MKRSPSYGHQTKPVPFLVVKYTMPSEGQSCVFAHLLNAAIEEHYMDGQSCNTAWLGAILRTDVHFFSTAVFS